MTNIEYAPPSPNPTPGPASYWYIPDVPDVTFTYDDAGNRKTMTDGSGNLAYSYDSLSRLVTETKTFADFPQNPYTLGYTYEISGGLKSITDPFNRVTTYTADRIGRITQIGGAGDSVLTGVSAYASDIQYRAFGAVKEMKMSTTAQTTLTMTYDNALRPEAYTANNSISNNIQSATYSYGNDGLTGNITNNVHAKFSQKNEYDFAGRLKKNEVGSPAAGYPFKQTMSYDAFDNLTARSNSTYGQYNDEFVATYTNNRKHLSGINITIDNYDAAGNVVNSVFYTSGKLSSPGVSHV